VAPLRVFLVFVSIAFIGYLCCSNPQPPFGERLLRGEYILVNGRFDSLYPVAEMASRINRFNFQPDNSVIVKQGDSEMTASFDQEDDFVYIYLGDNNYSFKINDNGQTLKQHGDTSGDLYVKRSLSDSTSFTTRK
jgi:hypothetical protein